MQSEIWRYSGASIAYRPNIVGGYGTHPEQEVASGANIGACHDGPLGSVPMQYLGERAVLYARVVVAHRPYVVGSDGRDPVQPVAIRTQVGRGVIGPLRPVPVHGEREVARAVGDAMAHGPHIV